MFDKDKFIKAIMDLKYSKDFEENLIDLIQSMDSLMITESILKLTEEESMKLNSHLSEISDDYFVENMKQLELLKEIYFSGKLSDSTKEMINYYLEFKTKAGKHVFNVISKLMKMIAK